MLRIQRRGDSTGEQQWHRQKTNKNLGRRSLGNWYIRAPFIALCKCYGSDQEKSVGYARYPYEHI